jgi:hypothetical protein
MLAISNDEEAENCIINIVSHAFISFIASVIVLIVISNLLFMHARTRSRETTLTLDRNQRC